MRFTTLVSKLYQSHWVSSLVILSLLGLISYLSITRLLGRIESISHHLIIGVQGQPRRIHPLWSKLNPIDESLTRLIYRSLIVFDSSSQPLGDLAERWEITPDQKGYKIFLKSDQYWQDGHPITTDDVVFSFQLTQHDDYTGPEKPLFQDVFIENTDQSTVLLTLKQPFAPFLESLAFPILPKHIWQETDLTAMQTSKYNLKPVGSTPFTVEKVVLRNKPKSNVQTSSQTTITELHIRNRQFGVENNSVSPYKQITIRFYPTQTDLTTAYKLGEIDVFLSSNKSFAQTFFDWPNTQTRPAWAYGQLMTVFFNLTNENSPASELRFRQNFRSIFQLAEPGLLPLVASIPSNHWAHLPLDLPEPPSRPQLHEYFASLEPLTLVAPNAPLSLQVAQTIAGIAEQFKLRLNLEVVPADELKNNVLPERKFDLLVTPQILGHDPDQYAIWHSTQTDLAKGYLNLSGYANRQADKALEDGMLHALDLDQRKTAYTQLQERLQSDLPALFFFYPEQFSIARISVEPQDAKPTLDLWHLNDYLISVIKSPII